MFLSVSYIYPQTNPNLGNKVNFPDSIAHSFHNPEGIELLLVADDNKLDADKSEVTLSISIKNSSNISYLLEDNLTVSITLYPGIILNIFYENDTTRQITMHESNDNRSRIKLRYLENGQELLTEYQFDFKYLQRLENFRSRAHLDSLIHKENNSFGKYFIQAMYYMPTSRYKNRKGFLIGPLYSNIVEINYVKE